MVKKLSIIVPVYKVEQYLNRCVDSILNQTYRNIEILLVDDGSPDRSGEICDRYAKSDERVKVVHKKNGGVSSARNIGFSSSTGEYIGYVDSDDYIAPTMYEDMIDVLEKNDLDIVCCDAFIVKGDKLIGKQGDGALIVYAKEDILLKSLMDFQNTIWNKLYKREMFENVIFPEGRLFEDNATAHLFFQNCKRVGCINTKYYYYYRNSGSITQTAFNTKARLDFVKAYIERLDFALKNRINCIPQCKSLLMKAALSCLTAVYVSENDEDNKKVYGELKKLILKYRDDKEAYCELNAKYKMFLWSFGRFDFIHKISAYISKTTKQIKVMIR